MLVFFDAVGRETGKFKFAANPGTGGSLQTLIATQEFASLPGAPVPDALDLRLGTVVGGIELALEPGVTFARTVDSSLGEPVFSRSTVACIA